MDAQLTRAVLDELDLGLPSRRADAVAFADGCLQLFETPGDELHRVRGQRWYRRVWEVSGGENLALLGGRCRHVEQARGVALEVLRWIGSRAEDGVGLVALVADELDHIQGRRGALPEGLEGLRREVRALAQALEARRQRAEDQRALSDEWKRWILRSMVAAAWADGPPPDPARRVLQGAVEALEVSPALAAEVAAALDDASADEPDLCAIEDPTLRELVYRGIVAVTVADGHLSLRENLLLGEVASRLQVGEEDAQAIERELFSSVSARGLDQLVRAIFGVEGDATSPLPLLDDLDGAPSTEAAAAPPPASPCLAERDLATHDPAEVAPGHEGGVAPDPARASTSAPASGGASLPAEVLSTRELWRRLALLVCRRAAHRMLAPLAARLRAVPREASFAQVLATLEARGLARDLTLATRDEGPAIARTLLGILRAGLVGATPPGEAALEPALASAGKPPLQTLLEAVEQVGQLEHEARVAATQGMPPALLSLLADPRVSGGLARALLRQEQRARRTRDARDAYLAGVRSLLELAETEARRLEEDCAQAAAGWYRHEFERRLVEGQMARDGWQGLQHAILDALAEREGDP